MKASLQQITKVIKSIDGLYISKQEQSRGRVSTVLNEGYKITKVENSFRIQYLPSSFTKVSDTFLYNQFVAIERIFIELSQAGHEVTLDGMTIVA